MSDFGCLHDYIIGASIKRLSLVECDKHRSNQHELNGTQKMKAYLGKKEEFNANFIRLDDAVEKIQQSAGKVTWYDARQKHPVRSEYRFYYPDNPAIKYASAGDSLAIILKTDRQIILVSAAQGSQSELELFELLGDQISSNFNVIDFSRSDEFLSASKRFILEELGIEIKADYGQNYLDLMTERFGALTFPETKRFSQLAREIAGDLNHHATADEAILHWWDTEEAMFKQLEAELINNKLSDGFVDSDDFLKFSQTIRQRRNSRAGFALENHLAYLFSSLKISYVREAKTENNKKPDFLFPSTESYHDLTFPENKLTMLGVKTSCKDRWRQVLTEADRIQHKHLFTLQPKISENQTREMIDANLQLVVPRTIHSTYTPQQQTWLWDLNDFIKKVSESDNC